MSFKRLVTLTCDGPCGLALSETEKAPAGWVKVTVMLYERLDQNQKPSVPAKHAWFCPKCCPRFYDLLGKAGFSFSSHQEVQS
jgi:hypothetical protein